MPGTFLFGAAPTAGSGLAEAMQQQLTGWARAFKAMQQEVAEGRGAAAQPPQAAGMGEVDGVAEAMVLDLPAPVPGGAQDGDVGGIITPECRGAHTTAPPAAPGAACPGEEGYTDLRLMRKLMDWPAAFKLFCWAADLVDR